LLPSPASSNFSTQAEISGTPRSCFFSPPGVFLKGGISLSWLIAHSFFFHWRFHRVRFFPIFIGGKRSPLPGLKECALVPLSEPNPQTLRGHFGRFVSSWLCDSPLPPRGLLMSSLFIATEFRWRNWYTSSFPIFQLRSCWSLAPPSLEGLRCEYFFPFQFQYKASYEMKLNGLFHRAVYFFFAPLVLLTQALRLLVSPALLSAEPIFQWIRAPSNPNIYDRYFGKD